MTIRIGQGVDVHAFATDDRPLVLGGVVIPGATGLAGHSDADVVLHAIVDALLGAVAMGDIGGLVGVDEPQTKGADSTTFVARARERLAAEGWRTVNVDATVLAQQPRLAAHIPSMRQATAEALGMPLDAVSVKATTTDRLGLVGRGDGIACTAVVLVDRPPRSEPG